MFTEPKPMPQTWQNPPYAMCRRPSSKEKVKIQRRTAVPACVRCSANFHELDASGASGETG